MSNQHSTATPFRLNGRSDFSETQKLMIGGCTMLAWAILMAYGIFTGIRYNAADARHDAGINDSSHDHTPAISKTPGQYVFEGLPLNYTGDPLIILTNTAYLSGYSEKRRNPLWVGYKLPKAPVKEDYKRFPRFLIDERTGNSVKPNAFYKSGYDRGHLAPSYGIAECYGSDAMVETYLMSNIAPQRPSLNRNIWRRLEGKAVRDYADRFDGVWVITGPIFDADIERLESGVEIPDAFYKIIADKLDGSARFLAFIIPQSVEGNDALDHFLTSVDEIEGATGLDFFNELPDGEESTLEGIRATEIW